MAPYFALSRKFGLNGGVSMMLAGANKARPRFRRTPDGPAGRVDNAVTIPSVSGFHRPVGRSPGCLRRRSLGRGVGPRGNRCRTSGLANAIPTESKSVRGSLTREPAPSDVAGVPDKCAGIASLHDTGSLPCGSGGV